MENNKTNVGVMYGLVNGVISCLFLLILYLAGVKWFIHPVAYLAYAIPIVIAVLAGIKQRKINGGYIEFGHALKTVFLVFVLGSLITTVFTYVLFNIIDIPFREAMMQEAAIATEKLMEKFGAPQDTIDKTVEDMLSGNSYSIGKILLSFAFGCIVAFIISLIIAAIIKRRRPEFNNV